MCGVPLTSRCDLNEILIKTDVKINDTRPPAFTSKQCARLHESWGLSARSIHARLSPGYNYIEAAVWNLRRKNLSSTLKRLHPFCC